MDKKGSSESRTVTVHFTKLRGFSLPRKGTDGIYTSYTTPIIDQSTVNSVTSAMSKSDWYRLPQNEVIISVYDIDYPQYVVDTNLNESQVAAYVPKPDPDGLVRYWGLMPAAEKVRFGRENVLAILNRESYYEKIYQYVGFPEHELITKLAERRLDSIKANKSAREPYYKYSYEVRIQLNGVYPEVFREVKVSGSMALRTFADKVILPAMGWERSYHCYYFTDVKDGSNYGRGTIMSGADGVFDALHGFEFINDEKVRLGDLLSPGDVLEFLYDFSVRWNHTITLLSAKPHSTEAQSSSDRFSHCTILYGEGYLYVLSPPSPTCCTIIHTL